MYSLFTLNLVVELYLGFVYAQLQINSRVRIPPPLCLFAILCESHYLNGCILLLLRASLYCCRIYVERSFMDAQLHCNKMQFLGTRTRKR